MWDVITHALISTTVWLHHTDVTTWISNYTPPVHVDVITYPYPNINADLVNIRELNSPWMMSKNIFQTVFEYSEKLSPCLLKSNLLTSMHQLGLTKCNGPWHDDVIKWKHFPRYWPFVWGIHRSPVNFPHKGQWRTALIFSLICAWINGWVNNHEAGDLRHHRAHFDVIVIICVTVCRVSSNLAKQR